MKILVKEIGGLSIDPRTIVHFKKGDILEPGIKGLSEGNINRLVELKLADIVDSEDEAIAEVVVLEPYDFENITDKTELEEYARDVYEVELDKRLSLKKMISKLKEIIERKV